MPNVIASLRKKEDQEAGARRGARGGATAPVPPSASKPSIPFAGAIQKMATPEGGMQGTSAAYRLGETTRAAAGNLAEPIIGAVKDIGGVVSAIAGGAKDLYQGVRGIPEGTEVTAPGPISNAHAAAAMPQAKVVQPEVSKPAAPAPQWTAGEQISQLGNGLFATGQGAPTHQRWGVNQGGVISNLTLPIGQNPNEMNPADYQNLIEKQDSGNDVTVGRGMREFKGGKEVVNSMTGQRRLADQIASMMGQYQNAVGQAPGPTEAANIIGNIASGEASKEQSRIAANAAVTAAQHKASESPLGNVKKPLMDNGKQMTDVLGQPILTNVPAQRIGDHVLFMDPEGPRLVPIEQVRNGDTNGGKSVTLAEFKKLLEENNLITKKQQSSWWESLFK